MQEKAMKGILFDIQRFSVHDGPGMRTNLFLKGCPLHCDWCCNPESQSPFPQPLYDAAKCIGCGACVRACPRQAITVEDGYRIDTAQCRTCREYACVRECYSTALSLAGTVYTVDQVMELVERDRGFYRTSGGGVTLTGGEAMMQAAFAQALLRRCKEAGIHTAIETCSACAWEDLRRTLPDVDVYLCDVKHTDPCKLKAETGGDAEVILGNIRKLAAHGAHVVARIPVIPGFNSDLEELRNIGEFLLDAGILRADLLTYHRMGEVKYRKSFSPHRPKERQPLSEEEMRQRVELLREMGLDAALG